MGQVDPRFSFEFDLIEKGTYKFRVKESGIEPQGEGKTSGKRYWVRCVVTDGDQEGLSHMESFFEKTKDDFSFSRMAGFLYKLGVIKTLGKVDTSMFLSSEFEERWKKQLVDRKFGAKISHRTKDKNGKDLDNPQSEMRVYYTYDEVVAILSKETGRAATTTSTAPVQAETPKPAQKAMWD